MAPAYVEGHFFLLPHDRPKTIVLSPPRTMTTSRAAPMKGIRVCTKPAVTVARSPGTITTDTAAIARSVVAKRWGVPKKNLSHLSMVSLP